MSDALTILHLYPRELGINGDAGNVMALTARAGWGGVPAVARSYEPGDDLPSSVDIVHIGSGPLSAQRSIYSDLLRIAPALTEYALNGIPFLAVAAGWQLLGTELIVDDTERISGVGIFPSIATIRPIRRVGEIVVDSGDELLAGFENHSTVTRLLDTAAPLGVVLAGQGDAAEGAEKRTEGAVVGNCVGTNLHGPFLPMNPGVADRLLTVALDRRGWTDWHRGSDEAKTADEYARNARRAIADRLGVQSSRRSEPQPR